MIIIIKRHRVLAVVGGVSMLASIAQAENFNASATLQRTLSISNTQNFEIGTVFATATGATAADGVGGFVVNPAGFVSTPATVGSATLTSLTSPTPAQGAVATVANFTLSLKDTSSILVSEFDGSNSGNIGTTLPLAGVELVHSTNNAGAPSLWLMHFTIGDVSGGASSEAVANSGTFAVVKDFNSGDYIFNIGATVTTEPGTGTAADYLEGIYSGVFEVTASY